METIKNRLNNLKEEILTQIKDVVINKFNGEWNIDDVSPIRRNVYDSLLDYTSIWEITKLHILNNEIIATFRLAYEYDDSETDDFQEEWFLKYEKIEDLVNLLGHLER